MLEDRRDEKIIGPTENCRDGGCEIGRDKIAGQGTKMKPRWERGGINKV